MPQLNRDILREVFNEIIKEDGSFNNIDRFMMAGKELFKLVLDICKTANNVVIFEDKIVAKFPEIAYKKHHSNNNNNNPPDESLREIFLVNKYLHNGRKKLVTGTKVFTNMLLFKPISIAFATILTSLDVQDFSHKLIRMLKFINWEMKEIHVPCHNLKVIGKACANISNVQEGVTVNVCNATNFCREMNSFAFSTQKLTINDAHFNKICEGVYEMYFHFLFKYCSQKKLNGNDFYNSYLFKDIRHLTIKGTFRKTTTFRKDLNEFADFLSFFFPNLETLNINFLCDTRSVSWDWNDNKMAKIFRKLPHGIKGCICFKINTYGNAEIDLTKYPGLQKNGDEHYKIFSITDTLSFKMASFGQNTLTHFGLFSWIWRFWNFDFIYNDFMEPSSAYPLPLIHYPVYRGKPKRAKFDKKQFLTKPLPPFKNQQKYFSR